ncbi:hypothetical protein MNBD_NITROSPINAE02-1945 [hydrothermal vent metagenome]|uniref:Cyclic nucleotide-binding domain-containing protein n=1 Tax=hydrothermal vent metagenome TaxID=652676 RepID=A0A3B1BXA2_9ZZZZ
MTIETIKAGQWVVAEGGVPEYSIYKLLSGTVSIYKSGSRIREVTINKGDKPIMIGITAIFRDDLMHMASVKAETDVEVDRIYIDQIRGTLANEIPKENKNDIAIMIKSITMGNELVSLVNKFYDLPKINLEIPTNVSTETEEILSEITRLYNLIGADIDKTCNT